jgi:hypothetical protein
MRKPPTGEPCAGKPHARFGGRGGATLPDPYHGFYAQPCVIMTTDESITTWNRATEKMNRIIRGEHGDNGIRQGQNAYGDFGDHSQGAFAANHRSAQAFRL